MNVWRRLAAYVRRDLREGRSRLGARFVELSAIALTVATFFFLARLVDSADAGEHLTQGYFAFAVQGFSIQVLLLQVIVGFSVPLRQAQLTGTLEILFAAPRGAWETAVGSALVATGRGIFHFSAYLFVGVCWGARFSLEGLALLPLVVLIAVVSFVPFGLLASATVILIQRSSVVTFLAHACTMLLSGVFFPRAVLPQFMQMLGEFYPPTHAIEALRAVTSGAHSAAVQPLVTLLAYSLVAIPASAWLLERAAAAARQRGTLAQT